MKLRTIKSTACALNIPPATCHWVWVGAMRKMSVALCGTPAFWNCPLFWELLSDALTQRLEEEKKWEKR